MTVIEDDQNVRQLTSRRRVMQISETWALVPVSLPMPQSIKDALLPEQLVERFISAALDRAEVEKMEDGHFFMTIPVLRDVWAEAGDEITAAVELDETLREWVDLKLRDGDRDFPIVGGINLNNVRL